MSSVAQIPVSRRPRLAPERVSVIVPGEEGRRGQVALTLFRQPDGGWCDAYLAPVATMHFSSLEEVARVFDRLPVPNSLTAEWVDQEWGAGYVEKISSLSTSHSWNEMQNKPGVLEGAEGVFLALNAKGVIHPGQDLAAYADQRIDLSA